MDFANRVRGHGQEPPFRAENARQHKPLPSMLAAAMAIGCAIVACPASARAQAPAKNLWQTYMAAALGSNQSDDFKVEAIALNAALAFAMQHDAQGLQPALTRLPLMLVYAELDRKDLIKPLADQGMHIDVSDLDKRFDDYISTVDNYASSYYDRWKAHVDDKPGDDFKQGVRFYGAKNSYRIEVALRTKLRLGDEIGLATAISQVGLVYSKGADLDCAGYDYGRAFQTFLDFQQKRDAMTAAGGRFSVGNPTTPTAEQSTMGQAVMDTQVYLVLIAAMAMKDSALETLNSRTDGSPPTNSELASKCDNFGPPARTAPAVGFDARISRVSEYFDIVLTLTSELRKRWPGNPVFGTLYNDMGLLYQMEFERSQMHPDQYPGMLVKARDAFEKSLAILTDSGGTKSQSVHAVAANYVDLLIKAKLPDEAKKIEDRYGVAPSN
jgi:hypothetical protein